MSAYLHLSLTCLQKNNKKKGRNLVFALIKTKKKKKNLVFFGFASKCTVCTWIVSFHIAFHKQKQKPQIKNKRKWFFIFQVMEKPCIGYAFSIIKENVMVCLEPICLFMFKYLIKWNMNSSLSWFIVIITWVYIFMMNESCYCELIASLVC